VTLQVAGGMAFLHDRQPSPVLHGDLKNSNILLEEDGRRVVLCDFGLAGWSHAQNAAMQRGALTVSIAPPEVLEDPTRPRTPAADVYAFSIVLLEIVLGRPAYPGMKASIVRDHVCAGLRPTIPESVPSGVQAIIHACWAQEADQRPTFGAVLQQLEGVMRGLDAGFAAGSMARNATLYGTDTAPGWSTVTRSQHAKYYNYQQQQQQ
jgi:serine/threonine protein kinase